jgi:hypothetical protein
MKNLLNKIFIFMLVILVAGCADTTSCHMTPDGKCDASSDGSAPVNASQVYGYPLNAFEGKPIRKAESVQQIWIGPYEDQDGNFHEPSYVYTVTKKGTWIGDPPKDIQG